MRSRLRIATLVALLLTCCAVNSNPCAHAEDLRILFLGDQGHHQPVERFAQLRPVLEERGIELVYTEQMAYINADALADFDGLMIYANINRISPDQEQALLDFVAGGKGLIPVHCASYCFLNSDKYIELVGAQFQRHGTGVFRTTLAEQEHPINSGFSGFESWDETYVHHRHNEQDRTVLAYRVDAEGREPWTWVRTHGEGRVFYTAWGHDRRTWSHKGFHNLIERGIRWAVGDDPASVPVFDDPDLFPIPDMKPLSEDAPEFSYQEAKIPFYPPSTQWGTMGEPITQMQLPLSAEDSMKHITTPVGFELQLFASDPDIKKPICMNWDERGRLWIAETVDYPNELQPEGQGRDQLKICEDTDGDGRADKFTVFADKLSIPTSIAFANGGVIVHQAPHTLLLKDTDGDDVADERRVLFTGWSTGDTHAGPSNMHYGLDNWIWGMVGYAGFDGEVGGQRRSFRTGFYRFRPDGSDIEFLRNTNNNSWGVGFNEEGVLFGSTANGNPSVYMPIANRHYERVRGWSSSVLGTIADKSDFSPITDKVRQVDWHGRYTAGAGHALYTARAWPKEYWNRTAFVAGPTGHLIGVFHIKQRGADYASTSPFNILASDDEWCAPIMAEVGPDGQLWVIDWYNYIVQHNPTPRGYETGKGNAYEIDLRDKRHGRIYRVVYADSADEDTPNLADADPGTLVAALSHPNLLWRKHAQRLLVERGDRDVVDQLVTIVLSSRPDEIGINAGATHALWTLHGLGYFDEYNAEVQGVLFEALNNRAAGVRRNAALVAPRTAEIARLFNASDIIRDDDPQVRLAALLALAEMPPVPENAATILSVLADQDDRHDRWLGDAAISAGATYDRDFLAAALGANADIEAVLNGVRIVAEHYARSRPAESFEGLIKHMSTGNQTVSLAIIDGFTTGWPDDWRVALNKEDGDALVELAESLPVGSRGRLVMLADRMGTARLEAYAREVSAALVKTLADEQLSDEQRLDAAQRLVEFRSRDEEVVDRLLEQVTPRMSPALTINLIETLRRHQADNTGSVLVAQLADWTPNAKNAALKVLLSRPSWTTALLAAMEDGRIGLSDLALDQKQALLAHPNDEISKRSVALMESGGAAVDSDRAAVVEAMMPVTEERGDPEAGKKVFTEHCAKCHKYQGEGVTIGPDLTGMSVHPKDELLMQILDPSRSVEGNYRSYTVVTVDGLVINGLLASETQTTIELFDTEGEKQIVLREDIEELIASEKSLMPEGFEEQLKPEQLTDLLEFLTQRGRFVPLPLERYATVVSTRGMFYDEASLGERLVFADWGPKEFNGVPFALVDPQVDRVPNLIMLQSPNGRLPPRMPRQVEIPINGTVKRIHMLSGISGWGAKAPRENGSVSMIVRLTYDDGSTEDHDLLDGVHFADYIGEFDVPKSELAFVLRGRQVRYLALEPGEDKVIKHMQLIKGSDRTAPIVVAITLE